MNAKAFVDRDLSSLLPYVKGDLAQVKFYPAGPFVKLNYQGHPVTINGDCIAIVGFEDDETAREFAGKFVALLKDIEARKGAITPDATPYRPPGVMEIFKLLPKKSNCGKCGLPTCMAFAAALCAETASPEACPELAAEARRENLEQIEKLLNLRA